MCRRSVIIRVDSGARIGSGHLMRCLNLAAELQARGALVRFVCRALPGHLIERAEAAGYPVHRLSALPGGEPACSPESVQQQDAAETLQAIGSEPAAWIVVDHYGLDAVWQRLMRPAAERLMVIDDLADRHHEADLLLDQNYLGPAGTERYSALVAASCRALLGPRYALLHPSYRALRRGLRVRDGAVRRMLVFFGARDPTESMVAVLQALAHPALAGFAVDAVLGGDAQQSLRARAAAQRAPQVTFHQNVPSLAGLIAAADLGIGAGGITTWERACLGLPSVVATTAENQEPPARALAAAGCIVLAGSASDMSAARWQKLLRPLLNDKLRLSALSRESYRLTDGLGAARVAGVMTGVRSTEIRLRTVREDDEWLLLEWANDPVARHFSFSKQSISAVEHHRWFHARLADAHCMFLIGEDAACLPLGQVRFDSTPGSEESTIHVSIDPAFRGSGVGTALVSQAVRAWRAHRPGAKVVAEVTADNIASKRLFMRANFAPATPRRPGSVAFELGAGSLGVAAPAESGA